jgi:Beta-propeller repeat
MRQGVRGSLGSLTAWMLATLAMALGPLPASAGTAAWMHQFGTRAPDDAEDIAVDQDGNVHVVGQTSGALPGQASAGAVDAYVRRYDAAGEEVWTRQFGSFERDFARGVAVDGTGNVYVVGQTFGTLPGQVSAGGFDGFVRKYDPAGGELWTRQFGSPGGEGAVSVAVDDAGRAHVAGSTRATLPGQVSAGEYDAFLSTYDPDGTPVWTRQFGTLEDDFAVDVAVDPSGAAVVIGQTSGTFPGASPAAHLDAFARRFAPDGATAWTRQFGTSEDDRALSVAVDPAGNSYVAGTTNGVLSTQPSAGVSDAFVRKFDGSGGDVWSQQFGTSGADDAASVAVDRLGSIYVVGRTSENFAGQVSAGDYDAYVRKHDPAGREIWTEQFGTSEGDYALAVALDTDGVAHAAGGTLGVIDGQATSGGRDAFAVRFPPSPPTRQAPSPMTGLPLPAAAAGEPGTVRISVSNFRFCPEAPCDASDQAYVRTDGGVLVDNATRFIAVQPGDTVVWTYQDTTCDGLEAGPLLTCPGHEVQFETGQTARGTVGTMPARQGSPSLVWHVPNDAQPGALYRYYCDLSDHWRLGVTGALLVVAPG